MEYILIISGIVTTVAVIWGIFFGKKAVIELIEERRLRKQEKQARLLGKPYHNLPSPDYSLFVDREDEIRKVKSLLSPSFRYPFISIEGVSGIGKSTLALKVSDSFRLHYDKLPETERFDAIIWKSAKQTVLTEGGIQDRVQLSPFETLIDLYATIATTLKRDDILHVSRAQQQEKISDLLANQRTLIIVDNFETVDDPAVLTFLSELPSPSKAIITSREKVSQTYAVPLKELPWEFAKELISKECEKHEVVLDDTAMRLLYDKTGGIPLAIVWSVAQLPLYDLKHILKRLTDNKDVVARYCFESVINSIREQDAYWVLLALSLFAIDADRRAIGFIAGLAEDDFLRDESLAMLEQRSLIYKESSQGRYRMLPLTKMFAQNELRKQKEFANTARDRFFEYMLNFVRNEVRTINYWDPLKKWTETGGINAEIENLLLCAKWAAETRRHDITLYVGGVLSHHLWRMGRIEDRKQVCNHAIFAARELGEHEWEVWLLIDGLGYIYISMQDFDKAQDAIAQGKLIAEKHGVKEGEALALTWMAYIASEREDFNQARFLLNAAEEKAKSSTILGRVKTIEGYLAYSLRDWAMAERYYKDAIYHRIQSDGKEPPAQLAQLGLVQALQGKYDDAKNTLQRAVGHERQSVQGLGLAYSGLALVEASEGDWNKALEFSDKGLEYLRRVGAERQIIQIQEMLEKIHRKKRNPLVNILNRS